MNDSVLEKLNEQSSNLQNSWKLVVQPGSIIKYFNLERRISNLDLTHQQPQMQDWLSAISLEAVRLVGYAIPLAGFVFCAYRIYSGNH